MKTKRTAILGGTIITPYKVIQNGVVLIDEEKIAQVGSYDELDIDPDIDTIDASGRLVCPGFVEVHIHGYGGIMMGAPDTSPSSPTNTVRGDILEVAKKLPATGITSFLPTLLIASSLEGILDLLSDASEAVGVLIPGADILGLHMEGPYFNVSEKGEYDRYPPRGAQPIKYFRKPNVAELHRCIEASNETLRMISLSPEIDGALQFIETMQKNDIVASGAHSFASYNETLLAVDAGMTTVTHMYNGMRRQDHREPGIIEAALTCDQIILQIISDNVHVHSPALEIAYRCKGKEKVAISTDNTSFAGMPNGSYKDLTGRELVKSDEFIQIVGGTLYGSVMPMNKQVKQWVNNIAVSVQDAIFMASVVPAQIVNVFDTKGSLEPGKDADILILNDAFDVQFAMCRGRKVLPTNEDTL
jgi:N-acetylglucosamine-6-phosphate deacetylase